MEEIATKGRISREKRIVGEMIVMYCHDEHRGGPTLGTGSGQTGPAQTDAGELCADCRRLLAYACERLDRCPFGEKKKSCKECPVHCYSPDCRSAIRTVMRHSGPRMIYRHPLDALWHILHS